MCPYGYIVREILSRAREFGRTEFVHEYRESNEDAHILARSSVYSSVGRHVWFMASPDGVCITRNVE
jgi:hypothetical protein